MSGGSSINHDLQTKQGGNPSGGRSISQGLYRGGGLDVGAT